jgi:homoserine dehydrogenase
VTRPPLRVAVLGAGTVGREVVREIRASWPTAFEIVGVAVRDLRRAATRGLPTGLLTDAPAHLVAGKADVIIELMGGEEPARTLIEAALGAGKAVVTANKYVLARHGAALERAARRTTTPLRFEAAVMGGTPVLRLLAEDLAATRVSAVRGIVNGTTNHILTEMAVAGLGYEEALAAARAAGYAEADPTADVEGGDAADKLVVLARLAFGRWLDRVAVPVAFDGGRPGITGVTREDIVAAEAEGLAIRLLARAERSADGVRAAVVPSAVEAGSAFGRTTGVGNRVEVDAPPLGTIAVEGPGAGGPATATAVLADLLAIAGGSGSSWAGLAPADGGGVPMPLVLDGAEVFSGPSGARYPIVS